MPKKIVLDLKADPDLLDITANEWAKAIERGTKKTQVRNFYDKVLELYDETKKESFEDVYPFIKMLNSKVAYGVTRKVVSQEFQNMMKQCIDQIKNDNSGKDKFETFKLFFEAVLGYFKGRD